MKALDIKENTLKYHNKNMYGKLGVKSRKELMQFAKENTLYTIESAEGTSHPID